MDTNKWMRHVEKFKKYNPKYEEYFVKPKSKKQMIRREQESQKLKYI